MFPRVMLTISVKTHLMFRIQMGSRDDQNKDKKCLLQTYHDLSLEITQQSGERVSKIEHLTLIQA